jgi:hypothetical protein
VAEEAEVLEALQARGIWDGRIFTRGALSGRLDFPAIPTWDESGALGVSVATSDSATPTVAAWFWVVEEAGGLRRREAWWSTAPAGRPASPWGE